MIFVLESEGGDVAQLVAEANVVAHVVVSGSDQRSVDVGGSFGSFISGLDGQIVADVEPATEVEALEASWVHRKTPVAPVSRSTEVLFNTAIGALQAPLVGAVTKTDFVGCVILGDLARGVVGEVGLVVGAVHIKTTELARSFGTVGDESVGVATGGSDEVGEVMNQVAGEQVEAVGDRK